MCEEIQRKDISQDETIGTEDVFEIFGFGSDLNINDRTIIDY
jgi:hypothetical protein